MLTRRLLLTTALATVASFPALAQFTGPSVQGQPTTVAQLESLRPGQYVTLEGNIVAHLRSDYYTFRDASGEVRVEIPGAVFGGRRVGPAQRVRIMGELDTASWGRYVWVKSLQPV